jgi:hypothetical protein
MKRRGRRTKKRLAIACLATLVVAMSVVWWGIDPCAMIATRLTHEVTDDPAARQQMRQRQLKSTRKEGAWACWMSVLFNRPTRSEKRHQVLMEARQIEQGWESGDETRRKLAMSSVLSAGRTNGEVLEQLLRTPDTHEALRAALAYDPGFRSVLNTAIKEECKYTSGETPQACRARYTTAFRSQ